MKVGRNDPCPCGSGKKYKHCCLNADRSIGDSDREQVERLLIDQTGFESGEELDAAMRRYHLYCENLPKNAPVPTFMEFLGRANTATEQQRQLREETAGRRFDSKEELEGFFESRLRARNDSQEVDFEGITRTEMHRLLNGKLEDDRHIITLANDLPDELALSSELIAAVKWILRYIVDHRGEVRLTARGNFPRVMCAAYLVQDGYRLVPGDSVPSEAAIPTLFTAHELTLVSGNIDESSTKSWITTRGVGTLAAGRWAQTFREAITTMIDEFDWQMSLSEGHEHRHFDIIQRAAVFLLLLLRNHPEGTEGEFFTRFVRAFPAYIEPAQEHAESVGLLRQTFEILFFTEFCLPFGLVRLDHRHPENTRSEGARYETTELFRAAFRWKR